MVKVLITVVLTAWLSLTAVAQRASTPRVVTMTRQMALFSELENQITKAQRENDRAAMDRLLADDFQVWRPSATGDPIPREDWEKQEHTCASTNTKLSQFATREFADMTVVNLRLTRTCKGSAKPQSLYVVDVWQKAGDDSWKLADRSEVAVPTVTVQVRPSGKD